MLKKKKKKSRFGSRRDLAVAVFIYVENLIVFAYFFISNA